MQAMEAPSSPTLQLIDSKGEFDEEGLDALVKEVRLVDCGLSYAVVAIIGAQSSGKSTLLNHLFRTRFREMNASDGRNQTTQGVWLATAPGLQPFTLVMDLEGADSSERGEDDTAFERQSSLFALAVADVLLINLWCHDIGRDHAANKPLLRTIFQAMMRLFTPRKTSLFFVIRDKTKTPLETLEKLLRDEVEQIWQSIQKPSRFQGTPLSLFFNVDVTALSNYETKEEIFREEVEELRKRFFDSIKPGRLAGDRTAVVPANGFPLSAREIWKVIKNNKDLDLPAHKVMIATVRCNEIAETWLASFKSDQEWQSLREDAKSGSISGFGNQASLILDRHISGYNAEVRYFEESVRLAKQNYLMSEILMVMRPAHKALLGNCRHRAMLKFKEDLSAAFERNEAFSVAARRCIQSCIAQFDRECQDITVPQGGWDTSRSREKLHREITDNVSALRDDKLKELVLTAEERLTESLADPVSSLLESPSSRTWPALRRLLLHETEVARSSLSSGLVGFGLDPVEGDRLLDSLASFGKNLAVEIMKVESGRALSRMKERFTTVFAQDAGAMPRVWNAKADVRSITMEARTAALKWLSAVAVLRFENDYDEVEATLSTLLRESPPSDSSSSSSMPSDRNKWVPDADVLLTPLQCKSLWRQLNSETEYLIHQALLAQEASKRGVSSWPPAWAFVVMIVLGWNELMFLIGNPLYILLVFLVYLAARIPRVRAYVGQQFQYGTLPQQIPGVVRLFASVTAMFTKHMIPGQQQQQQNSHSDRFEAQAANMEEEQVCSTAPNISAANERDPSPHAPRLRSRGEGSSSFRNEKQIVI